MSRQTTPVGTRTLILMRHAKSSWADPGQDDIDRPLNERGKANAPLMAERLKARGIDRLDLIVSSPARRALGTAKRVADAFGYARECIQVRDALYAASAEAWLEAIHALVPQQRSVLIVGHNPEVTEVAGRVCPQRIDNLPTAGMLVLRFALPAWADVGAAAPVDWDYDWPRREPR